MPAVDELAIAAINGAAAKRQAELAQRPLGASRLLRGAAGVCAERRKDQARDIEGLGRCAASIPQPYYRLIEKLYPELSPKHNPDQADRNRAWLKWLKSEAARPFLNMNKP